MDITSIHVDRHARRLHPGRDAATNSAMGKDQFLKLFVAQLQHQDPMNPMQDQDFMGQMALVLDARAGHQPGERQRAIAANSALSQSVGLIGRTVTWTDGRQGDATPASSRRSTPDGREARR